MAKRKHEPEPDPEPVPVAQAQEADEYDVEVITSVRVYENEDGEIKYTYKVKVRSMSTSQNCEPILEFLKWDGYSSDFDTWEPHGNLGSCGRLLKKLWKEIGKRRKKEMGDHEASEAWIKKQRARYQKAKKAEEKKNRTEKLDRMRAGKIAKKEAEKKIKMRDDSYELPTSESEAESSDSDDAAPLNYFAEHTGPSSLIQGKPGAPLIKNDKKKAMPVASSSTLPPPSRTKTSNLPSFTKKKNSIPLLPKPVEAPTVKTVPRMPVLDAANRQSRTPTAPTVDSPFLPQRQGSGSDAFANMSEDGVLDFLATMPATTEGLKSQKPGLTVSTSKANSSSRDPNTAPKTPISRWAWEGDLIYGTSDKAETLCQVHMSEPVNKEVAGFKLKMMLKGDSLRFSKAYKPWELMKILKSLGSVAQYSRLMPHEEKDKEAFSTFAYYLESRELVVTTGCINNYGHVAEFIIYPTSNVKLSERLRIPKSDVREGQLFIALAPWIVSPSKYQLSSLLPDETRELPNEASLEAIKKSVHFTKANNQRKVELEVAYGKLGMDLDLVAFLLTRKYHIWAREGDSQTGRQGNFLKERLETKALVNVLASLRAEEVPYGDERARLVFIHAGAMRTLGKMPGLVERRAKAHEFRFFTYGTHENANPSSWGIREVFPLGGVVTFTANALLTDRLAVEALIQKIHRHPLWTCYLLPSALSVFVRMSCLDDSPISVFEHSPETFGRILQLIDQGHLALCSAPPLLSQPRPEAHLNAPTAPVATWVTPPELWIEQQLLHVLKSPADLVREAWDKFDREFADMSDEDGGKKLQKEITDDLGRMTCQTVMQERYRRFVVIRGEDEGHIKWDQDGFEWRTAAEFEFGDEPVPKRAPQATNASM